MASVLSKPLGAVGAASLVAGSIAITMAVKAGGARSRTARFVLAALLCGVGFLVAVWLQFSVLLRHHTLIARESSSPEAAIWVYDGVLISESPTDISLDGLRAPWPPDAADASVASTNAVAPIELDIHSICPADVAGAASGPPAVYMIPADAVIDRSNYGPWKNLFFACYFTLNAAVAAHLIVAMFVTAAMLLKSIYSPAPFKRLPVLAVFWRFITCAGVVVAVLMVLS
jgi:heme/copper-type cytochrome/quinol oxidase subunit 3